MASVFVHAERSAPECYSFRVSRLGSNQRTMLLPGDIFKFSIRVSLNTTPTPTLLLYSPSQTVPCHSFLQESQFLKTLLSRIHSFIDSMEEITEGVVSCVQELFQIDGVASTPPPPPPSSGSQHQEIPLWLEMTLHDTGLLAAMEESTQCVQGQCCPICREELDANGECYYSLPCDHPFHDWSSDEECG